MTLNRLFIFIFAFGYFAYSENGADVPLPPLPSIETKENIESLDEKIEIKDYTKENVIMPRFFNAIDFSGYFRLRLAYFNNPHLGVYVPSKNQGISLFAPNLSMVKAEKKTGNNDDEGKKKSNTVNNFSANMRFRLQPKLNVSESAHIYGTFDMLDNLVLGSETSFGNFSDSFKIKNLFSEINSPIGDLRFGRMPLNWGLGILYNSGEGINDDYGDHMDGLWFSTRLLDHYLSLGYAFAHVGLLGRGYGINKPEKEGQLYPLEPSDIAHVFSLSFLKQDTAFIKHIFQYGLFASYRYQNTQNTHKGPLGEESLQKLSEEKIEVIDAHIGHISLWSALTYGYFHLGAEAIGSFGRFKNQTFFNYGLALESRYGFLEDQLQIGIDGGFASGNQKEGFSFNKAYTVDLLMYREVLGQITGSFYVKPHIAYFFSQNFGLRADVIASFTKQNPLGVEIDGAAFLRSDSGFYFSLNYGVLFPLKGLNPVGLSSTSDITNYGTAKTAHTLQGYLGVTF